MDVIRCNRCGGTGFRQMDTVIVGGPQATGDRYEMQCVDCGARVMFSLATGRPIEPQAPSDAG